MVLTTVDKLEFLVLVDNCIEWFSALPPGFSHEVPQHLSAASPYAAPIDELTGLPYLDFENYCCGAHGLSVWLSTEVDGKRFNVLMDAGPEGLTFERNTKAMHVPMDELDAIVLSHWHRDHSGGILTALSLRHTTHPTLPPLKVDLHPSRPIRRGISRPPNPDPFVNLPPDPTLDEIASHHGVVDLHSEFHEIAGNRESNIGALSGIGVSGEVKRRYGFEKGIVGAKTWMEEDGEGGWYDDPLIMDERYVAVDVKGKGLVIFSSCSHAGICNVLTDALEKHARPIHMVVGGLHLVPVEQQPAVETVDFLSRRIRPTPEYVLPLHCTGLEPRAMLRAKMGKRVVSGGVGMKVVVEGTGGDEELDHVDLGVVE